MTPTNLIKEELTKWYASIEGIEIKYEFNKNIWTHFIEIMPFDLFESDEAYILKEIAFEEKFSNLFPNEDLTFISEESLCKIGTPDLILSPNHILYQQEKKPFRFNSNFSNSLEKNNYTLAA